MVFQEYEITLSNGTIIKASEPYETPEGEMDFIEQYAKSDDNKLFGIGDSLSGRVFVLRRSIVSIRQTDVVEVEDWKVRALKKYDEPTRE